jgi:hypothetical protein
MLWLGQSELVFTEADYQRCLRGVPNISCDPEPCQFERIADDCLETYMHRREAIKSRYYLFGILSRLMPELFVQVSF